MNRHAGTSAARWFELLVISSTLLHCSIANAQPGKEKDPLSWDRNVGGLVQKYCHGCHNAENTRGGVNLAQDRDPRLIMEHRETWETALEMVESEEMPPSGLLVRKPSDEDRAIIVEFLELTLSDSGLVRPDPGKPVLHRLNRVEYDNAIADLTGLDLDLADGFPPDPSGYGFDNIGEALTLSPLQVDCYHDAARKVVAALLDAKTTHPQAYAKVFWIEPGEGIAEEAAARQVIDRFAERAFRRPVEPARTDRLMTIYHKAREEGESHEQAIGHMVTAVLIVPQFLCRVERNQPGNDQPYRVDDYELASRLSFFLWSRPPDDQLLQLASKDELGKTDVLEAQTRRMLADPRSRALVDNFFGQWLELRSLSSYEPDQSVFPGINDELRDAIGRETEVFLTELIEQDRPVTELIDAPYTYVNEPLANFYGLPNVEGPKMRRVELPDRRRGGLLTSAALLMLQSDPTRTNVPRRGNFIAGRILGDPPPPPPPGVPMLEEVADDGQNRTLRELLEMHRSKPECANCHAKIDPFGFSLENYNAIGRWRERDAGKPINASAQLADGRAFTGPEQLKDVLMERKNAFLETFTRNLLIYALGRGLQQSDQQVVRDALDLAASNEDRFSSIVLAIVRSYPFLCRRNPEY